MTPSVGSAGRANLASAREVAEHHVRNGSLPCAVFGVATGSGATGIVAVGGEGTSVAEDSIFFLASVTKPILATAVMQYVDEGRLDLHAPLARYLPEMTGEGREGVAAWHLLTHTSGLEDVPPERMRSERPTYRRILEVTLASAPRWPPGSRYEYNSSAWVLLGELMARLSGTPFPGVLERRIIRPLGMTSTTFDGRRLRERIVPVDGIEADSRLVQEVLLWFLARAALPGGGLFGSVADLLRFGRALLPSSDGLTSPRLLSRGAVAAMAELQTAGIPVIAEDGSVSEMQQGLGWRKATGPWPPGDTVLTHSGQTGTRLWVDPASDLVFAFLTNRWGADSEVALAVLEEVYRSR